MRVAPIPTYMSHFALLQAIFQGVSSNGKTAASKPADGGSIPSTPAILKIPIDNSIGIFYDEYKKEVKMDVHQVISDWYNKTRPFPMKNSLWYKFEEGDITIHRGIVSHILTDKNALRLSVVFVKKEYRNTGLFNKIIEILESVTKQYVVIENVVNPIVSRKLSNIGYTHYTDKTGKQNYYKSIK